MRRDRFSNDKLAQLRSISELRATRDKVNDRLEILEDKFETDRCSLFSFDSIIYGIAHKITTLRDIFSAVADGFGRIRDDVHSLRDVPPRAMAPRKPQSAAKVRESTPVAGSAEDSSKRPRRRRRPAKRKPDASKPSEQKPSEAKTE